MKTSKTKQGTENGFVLSFGKWEGTEQTTEEIKAEIKNFSDRQSERFREYGRYQN
jgi:hypothetical protein